MIFHELKSIWVAEERLNGSTVCPQQQIWLYKLISHSFISWKQLMLLLSGKNWRNKREWGKLCACSETSELQRCRRKSSLEGSGLRVLEKRTVKVISEKYCGCQFSFTCLCVFNSLKQWVKIFQTITVCSNSWLMVEMTNAVGVW